jgi:hypothetical protein
MLELLRWLEERYLVMIAPPVVLIILGAWTLPCWLLYEWIGRTFDFKRLFHRRKSVSRGYLSRRRIVAPKIIQLLRSRGARWN